MPFRRLALLVVACVLWTGGTCAAPLEELRAAALAAANADRANEGLPLLALDGALNAAAQGHAEDMRRRGYVGHVSPEGRDAMDRYRAAGGAPWRKVGENVAHCAGCGEPDAAAVRRFERGWMESAGHRRNVLDPGFRRLGYGLAAGAGQQYAVQLFAGPGGEGGGAPIAPDEIPTLAATLVNAEREDAGAPGLEAGRALTEAAARLLRRRMPEGGFEGAAGALLDELGPGVGEVAVLIGQCGGCGAEPGADDVRRFLDGWLRDPSYRGRLLDPGFAQLGFALWADGEGRKAALAVLVRP